MKKFLYLLTAGSFLVFASCEKPENPFDASGSFEASEVIISSEASGKIMALDLSESQVLEAGQVIGYIDSTQLVLKRNQLEAQAVAVLSRQPNVAAQLAALKQQLSATEKERQRVQNLVDVDAATTKQLDDINAQIEVLKKQIDAQKSALEISIEGMHREVVPVRIQIEQIEDQLRKCQIVNPINGTVLVKYAEANEMTAFGKPLYKIADLSTVYLRAYITGDQLPNIKLNQQVQVHTDDGAGGFKENTGVISWINDQAEFTPKTIQTKEERANLVYAIKVRVKNDGSLKIGMYGEIKF
ncbi:MAG: efflux RND transporter periplasmic adaptor subunit [Saprospiraceae bacterium]|nr:efflux RND transporter periplasmic adaptor subunit [Saprospiraceae bacterium]